jgi:DHA2 family multidrug resistance protein
VVLPPIRLALSLKPLEHVADASGLFNVLRNIGGALGIAVVDTMMRQRAPIHADDVADLVKTNPDAAAAALGIPVSDVPAPDDMAGFLGISDQIQSAGLTMAINECWVMLAAAALLALPALWILGPVRSALPVKLLGEKSSS